MASISPSLACLFPPKHQDANINSLHKGKASFPHKKTTCKARTNRNTEPNDVSPSAPSQHVVDRRDLLLALTGAGAAGAITTLNPRDAAYASPIAPLDLTKCNPTLKIPQGASGTFQCCLPTSSASPIDFVPPTSGPFRIRQPAHLVSSDYIKKYNAAYKAMKELPENDPRSFKQQAKIHCAYCNGAYDQKGSDQVLQIHNSWLFLPFHRLYLYFHEQILGSLIGDESFALPFWNWDNPNGMKVPPMYLDYSSSIYDSKRNLDHLYRIVDLDYTTKTDSSSSRTDDEQIDKNLKEMYKVMFSSKTPEGFMGKPYSTGSTQDPGAGSLEAHPHIAVHLFVGEKTIGEDMGRFYSAGLDPLFYTHHTNIDRLWNVWRMLGKRPRKDFDDKDYLEASFLFYDENAQPVRVKVKDALDSDGLRYKYKEEAPNPWLFCRPTPTAKTQNLSLKPESLTPASAFPVALAAAVTTKVERPKLTRNQNEKDKEVEELVVKNIEYESDEPTKFDVYVNCPNFTGVGPESTEFAGCFSDIPHAEMADMKGMKSKTELKLGITELLEDLGKEADDAVLVTLVPRSGNVTIGGVEIKLSPY